MKEIYRLMLRDNIARVATEADELEREALDDEIDSLLAGCSEQNGGLIRSYAERAIRMDASIAVIVKIVERAIESYEDRGNVDGYENCFREAFRAARSW